MNRCLILKLLYCAYSSGTCHDNKRNVNQPPEVGIALGVQ